MDFYVIDIVVGIRCACKGIDIVHGDGTECEHGGVSFLEGKFI